MAEEKLNPQLSAVNETSAQQGQLITDDLARQWFNGAQRHVDFPAEYQIDRGGGLETVIVDDMVMNGREEARRPIAIIINSDGSKANIGIKDLLEWRGLSGDEVDGERSAFTAADKAESETLTDKRSQTVAHLPTSELVEEAGIDYEGRLYAHYDKVFKPLGIPAQQEVDRDDLSELLDASKDLTERSVESAAVREAPVGLRVTSESEQDAVDQLKSTLGVDQGLNGLLVDYMAANGLDISDVPKALRIDAKLRKQVGLYFLDKVSKYVLDMAPRVVEDGKKAILDSLGGTVSSREATALMALAKIDGTFIKELQDKITYSPSNRIGGGQHRYSADILLSRS